MKMVVITLAMLTGMSAFAGPRTIVCTSADKTRVTVISNDGNDTDYNQKHQVIIEQKGKSSNYLYNLNLDGRLANEKGVQYEAGAEAADYPVLFFYQSNTAPYRATLVTKSSGNVVKEQIKLNCVF